MEQICILISSVWEVWGTPRWSDSSLPRLTPFADNSEVFPNSLNTGCRWDPPGKVREKRCVLFVWWQWLIFLMVPLFPCLPSRVYCQHSSQYDPVKTQVGPCHSSACRIPKNSILFKAKAKVLPKAHEALLFLVWLHFLLISCSPSIPATCTFLLWLNHPNQTPASGSLHFLFPLPGTPFPRSLCTCPYFLQLYSNWEFLPENSICNYNSSHQRHCLAPFPDVIVSVALLIFQLAYLDFILLST